MRLVPEIRRPENPGRSVYGSITYSAFQIAVPQNDPTLSRARETAFILFPDNEWPAYIFIVGNGFRQITFNCGLPEFVSTFSMVCSEKGGGEKQREKERGREAEEKRDRKRARRDKEENYVHVSIITSIWHVAMRNREISSRFITTPAQPHSQGLNRYNLHNREKRITAVAFT